MKSKRPDKVAHKLKNLPTQPGCYLYYNDKGKVIYVGKAIVLRNRVRSYFHSSAQHSPKTVALVNEIRDIHWWVTETELEALMLENELIKRHWPHYNVRLKDDKNFPYIKVQWQDDYPKIQVVHRIQKDGARYFGPYTSSRASYQTLDALRRVFPYLDCDRTIDGKDERACLYYDIKLCGGPCIGAQNREEYRQTVRQLMDFLEGKADETIQLLEEQMARAAENLQFELAALYRDRLKAAQRIAEQQKIVSPSLEDADYIALAQDERTGDTAVQVFTVRNGRLMGRESFLLEGAETPQADVNQQGMLISAFIQQFYDNVELLPKLILVQAMPDNEDVLSDWLSTKRESQVELRLPQRGPKRDLLRMAQKNAAEYLRLQQAEWAADTNRQTEAVTGLAKGAPLKSAYKRFKIRGKGSDGAPDDFASMEEILRRRFRRAVEEEPQHDPGKKGRIIDENWRILPDLVIIDGGKGQLGIAVNVLKEFGLSERVPVVGLAKREEEVFRPGESKSVWLERGSQALYLVQRIRDETHRFGITYHRKLRGKAQTRSKLDDIKGIGPKRRKALQVYFGGDIEKIRQASVDDLLAVPGMNRKAAEAVKEHFS